MKKNLHPEVFNVTVRCACGTTVDTISTSERLDVDICSGCHPLCTGQQKCGDTAGRIEKFQARYNTAKKQD